MTYREGLGQINIARDPSTLIRSLQYQLQQRTTQPTTAVLVRQPTTTFAPQPKPTPVLTIKPTTITPPPSPTPVFKITVSAPKPATTTTRTVAMKPVSGGIITETLAPTLAKSPLPLIAIGLGALWLFNRKKGR